MLGLSTHDPYFYILRETIIDQKEKNCTICFSKYHFFTECPQYKGNSELIEEELEEKEEKIAVKF